MECKHSPFSLSHSLENLWFSWKPFGNLMWNENVYLCGMPEKGWRWYLTEVGSGRDWHRFFIPGLFVSPLEALSLWVEVVGGAAGTTLLYIPKLCYFAEYCEIRKQVQSLKIPLQCMLVFCAHSCPTVCEPIDCCLPGSSVHGILQARILE